MKLKLLLPLRHWHPASKTTRMLQRHRHPTKNVFYRIPFRILFKKSAKKLQFPTWQTSQNRALWHFYCSKRRNCKEVYNWKGPKVLHRTYRYAFHNAHFMEGGTSWQVFATQLRLTCNTFLKKVRKMMKTILENLYDRAIFSVAKHTKL